MSFKPLVFPPWLTWGQRRGADLPLRPLGPGGKRLCGWCDTEVAGRRTRWCSNACSEAFGRVATWGGVKRYVTERDGFTCQRCRTQDPPSPQKVIREFRLTEVVFARVVSGRRDPWDVDHIVRVVDGGTDDPANLRLLCIECHRLVGYLQRARVRAEQSSLFDRTG